MGKIKGHCQDFLEEGGYDLGYDIGNLPELSDFKLVLKDQIDAQDYSERRSLIKKEVQDFQKTLNKLGVKQKDIEKAMKDNKKEEE